MTTPTLSQEQQVKLRKFIDDGMVVLQDIDVLKEGLKETAKDLAEQFDVKPALLNKALRTAFKQSLEEERTKFETVEDLLQMANR